MKTFGLSWTSVWQYYQAGWSSSHYWGNWSWDRYTNYSSRGWSPQRLEIHQTSLEPEKRCSDLQTWDLIDFPFSFVVTLSLLLVTVLEVWNQQQLQENIKYMFSPVSYRLTEINVVHILIYLRPSAVAISLLIPQADEYWETCQCLCQPCPVKISHT